MAWSEIWRWSGVGALIPILYGASFLVPAGEPQPVEACSFEPDVPMGGAPSQITIRNDVPGPAVGSDAFFTFGVEFIGTDTRALFDALVVEVRTEAGDVVAGEKELLDDKQYSTVHYVLVGWTSDTPRADAESLTWTVTAPSLTGSRVADRVTVRDPLPDSAEFSFDGGWLQIESYHPSKSAPADAFCTETSTCSEPFEVGYLNAPVQVMEVGFLGGAKERVAVLREFAVAAIPGKGELMSGPPPWRWLGSTEIGGGTFLFADLLDEYCVLVSERDLRTEEVRSHEVCGTPTRPVPETIHDPLIYCDFETVPPELRARYCSQVERTSCASFSGGVGGVGAIGGIGGAGGIGGVGGVGTSAGAPSVAGAPSSTGGNARPPAPEVLEPEPRRTSKAGCSLAAVGGLGPWHGLAPFALLLLSAWSRRRASWRSGRA